METKTALHGDTMGTGLGAAFGGATVSFFRQSITSNQWHQKSLESHCFNSIIVLSAKIDSARVVAFEAELLYL